MSLPELGEYIRDHPHPITNLVLRVLGITALDLLVQEVFDTPEAAARWEER